MENRTKLIFVCTTLALGGAERLMLDLLGQLDRERYILHLVYAKKDDNCLQLIPGHVTCHYLGKKGKLDFFRLILALAALYKAEKPRLVVSFIEYANYLSLLATFFSPVKPAVFITVHNYLSRHHIYKGKQALRKIFIRWLYPRASRIITVSRGVMDDLAAHFHCPLAKLTYIHNCIDPELIARLSREEITDRSFLFPGVPYRIIACGRLNYQKDYPLLLHAFARVLKQLQARLFILGEGPDLPALQQLAAELQLASHVTFMGFKKNPFKYMATADLFVLSSRYEGFGNVIIEAMACSTAVLATDCPAGPAEIITHGENGWLVPAGDSGSLATAMIRLLQDDALRAQMAAAGQNRALDFSVPRITARYEQVWHASE